MEKQYLRGPSRLASSHRILKTVPQGRGQSPSPLCLWRNQTLRTRWGFRQQQGIHRGPSTSFHMLGAPRLSGAGFPVPGGSWDPSAFMHTIALDPDHSRAWPTKCHIPLTEKGKKKKHRKRILAKHPTAYRWQHGDPNLSLLILPRSVMIPPHWAGSLPDPAPPPPEWPSPSPLLCLPRLSKEGDSRLLGLTQKVLIYVLDNDISAVPASQQPSCDSKENFLTSNPSPLSTGYSPSYLFLCFLIIIELWQKLKHLPSSSFHMSEVCKRN